MVDVAVLIVSLAEREGCEGCGVGLVVATVAIGVSEVAGEAECSPLVDLLVDVEAQGVLFDVLTLEQTFLT